MFHKISIMLGALVSILVLNSCGGGSTPPPVTPDKKIGYLVDAPIKGIEYRCGETVGFTNIDGKFECTELPVSFYIGNMKLGELAELTEDSKIFPADLFGLDRNNTTDEKIINLAILLQSLDNDNNLSNGIEIDSNVSQIFSEDTNFSSENFETIKESILESNPDIVFVSAEEAIAHLTEEMFSGETNTTTPGPIVVVKKPAPTPATPTDTTPPIITIIGDNPLTLQTGSIYIELGATTDDGSDINISHNINMNVIGVYSVTYISFDESNNSDEEIRMVRVIADESPTLSIRDSRAGEILGVTLINKNWVTNSVTFTFSFSEPMTGFTSEDISLSGAVKEEFAGSGDTYTLKVRPPLHSKEAIKVLVDADSSFDSSNNPNPSQNYAKAVNTVKEFITIWDTTIAGSSTSKQIKIQLSPSYTYGYDIDWGDSKTETNISMEAFHDYPTEGNYTVKISGVFPHHKLYGSNDSNKIISIEQWGTQPWKSVEYAFIDCPNLQGNFVDSPNLSELNSTEGMFEDAILFDANLSSWDVSGIINMTEMFYGATAFNGDISGWDVSSVTDMGYMFNNATAFNSDMGSWDVAWVTDMEYMFSGATSFNQDISAWNVSSVTNMSEMFSYTETFNQDLSSWDISLVEDMNAMFYSAIAFNGDISTWTIAYISSVTNMSNMFSGAIAFNGDISSWDVSKVRFLNGMLNGASAFSDHNLSGWDVGLVENSSGFMTNSGSGNTEPLWD
ncbi:MAG: BspA family leucine-rich repeat surface protein [Sulfurovum sp.]